MGRYTYIDYVAENERVYKDYLFYLMVFLPILLLFVVFTAKDLTKSLNDYPSIKGKIEFVRTINYSIPNTNHMVLRDSNTVTNLEIGINDDRLYLRDEYENKWNYIKNKLKPGDQCTIHYRNGDKSKKNILNIRKGEDLIFSFDNVSNM